MPNGILHGMEHLMGELGVGHLPPQGPHPVQQQQPQQQQQQQQAVLEKDYYGCFCLKFIVKNGSHITEDKVQEDFGQFGEVVDVRGPGLFSGLRGNHVYVRFIDRDDAEDALRQLSGKYHQLTPASISDVLPDNYGLYTISFYNKTGIPSAEVRKEFSQFGEVKNLTGSLDVKGGRVFVSYKDKTSAVQALQAFFFRKERYPNMKFALPRCEKDYFGCYCLKFYNKSGDVTEEKVLRDFGQFGEVVDVRGPGLFDVTGDDVYVRYKEKTSAEQALIELVGKYDSLCLAPPSDIQADKFGYFTITFVNDKCLSKSDVWYIFSKFGTVACVNGTFDCKKGRVFVSYKDKQGALNALETMLITKEYHLQVSKNSTVRKNDYNVVGGNVKEQMDVNNDFGGDFGGGGGGAGHVNGSRHNGDGSINGKSNIPNSLSSMVAASIQHQAYLKDDMMQKQHQQLPPHHHQSGREHSRSREASLVQNAHHSGRGAPSAPSISASTMSSVSSAMHQPPPPLPSHPPLNSSLGQHVEQNTSVQQQQNRGNGLVKFNRNVGKDIFGYFCLSFLNEDGDINEKKVRHDFGKFGEVVSVRGALGKQKGHVFVRFRRKESAENCLNCLNSFPLSEMSELFGKYLFLSPATPRDIDCDMYGFFSISFLNLNMKTFREIRAEFSKFGDIVRLTSGGGGNTDELVSISYKEKSAAVKALQTHFTNKEFPYLDIAKGSSLLLVTSSDSSDNEDGSNEVAAAAAAVAAAAAAAAEYRPGGGGNRHHHNHHHHQHQQQHYQHQVQQQHQKQQHHQQHQHQQQVAANSSKTPNDPFHDPRPSGQNGLVGSSDVVDELLKPLQSYFSIYRTGQYHGLLGGSVGGDGGSIGSSSCGLDGSGLGPLVNGGGMPRSPDKKYRIKSVKPASSSSNGHSPSNSGKHMRNDHPVHPPPLHVPPPTHNAFSVPPPSAPPVASAMQNGSASSGLPSMLTGPPPPTTNPDQMQNPPPSQALNQVAPVTAHPADVFEILESREKVVSLECNGFVVLSSSTPSSSSTTSKEKSSTPEQEQLSQQSMPEAIAAQAVAECAPVAEAAIPVTLEDHVIPCAPPAEPFLSDHQNVVHEDYLGSYSLSFCNRCKDLSERKIRLDLSREAGVSPVRVRGLAGLSKSDIGSGEVVTISFADRDSAETAVKEAAPKYPGLRCAPRSTVRADKDGFFSVEFINSGMSGIREITNEFSKHGEVSKVMAGGGSKNAVKRVTVSYAEKKSAFAAVRAHANSKDFASLDIAKDNVFEDEEGTGDKGKQVSSGDDDDDVEQRDQSLHIST
jgi:RNA recognition motif-containing protein